MVAAYTLGSPNPGSVSANQDQSRQSLNSRGKFACNVAVQCGGGVLQVFHIAANEPQSNWKSIADRTRYEVSMADSYTR